MAGRPKFKPNETPIENYQQGAVNWSMFTAKYDDPIGPEQKQYDPYYMYTVLADMGGQQTECAWFVNVDEHRIIQKAGTMKGSVMAATYVKENKRRGLVVAHSGGPLANRSPEQVDAETDQALAVLAGNSSGGSQSTQALPQVMLPPEMPTYPVPPQSAVPQVAPPAPQIPQPTPDPYTRQPTPQPATQSRPAPPPSYKEDYGREQKVYMPMTEMEMKSWQAYWRDLAKLHVWAYHEFPKISEELGLPKIKPSDQREMTTSVTIETWRQMGRGQSPLVGWIVRQPPPPPPDLTTKNGALEGINQIDPAQFANAAEFVRRWLEMMVPSSDLENWKHAGNIAKLLGLDSEVLFNEHDSDHLLLLTQAIWTYNSARIEDDLTRNEALELVADEYGLPKELMEFEPEDDEEDSELPEPAF